MTICKNCGHRLTIELWKDCGKITHYSRTYYNNKCVVGKFGCGCTNPEPKEVSP